MLLFRYIIIIELKHYSVLACRIFLMSFCFAVSEIIHDNLFGNYLSHFEKGKKFASDKVNKNSRTEDGEEKMLMRLTHFE